MSRHAEQHPTPSAAIADYAAGPERLDAALAGLSEAQLNLSCPGSAAGDWPVRLLAHHIADGDDLWKTPIKMALGSPEAVFSLEWYWACPQDDWTQRWSYGRRALAPSLALFRANRAHIVQLLDQVPDGLERAVRVRWPDGRLEPVSIHDILQMQAGHALGHVADILLIRRQHGL